MTTTDQPIGNRVAGTAVGHPQPELDDRRGWCRSRPGGSAGSITEVQVAGRGGVPTDAVAAVLNVTVAGPVADGFATVFPCGQPVPTASNLNYRTGVDIANTATVKLGDGGKACIYTFATTHLLADVNGHITA